MYLRKYTEEIEKLEMALKALIDSAHSDELIENFIEAYKYRSQFQHLEESGRSWGTEGNRNGLASALSNALGFYLPFLTEKTPVLTAESYMNASQDPVKTVSKTQLLEAIKPALADQNRPYWFIERLERYNQVVADLELGDLTVVIARALQQYIDTHRQGTSLDPW